jgi:hypothetical protein
MPRYFFHILHPDSTRLRDDEGAEFQDADAAKHEAVASVRDIVANAVLGGSTANGIAIEVRDAAGGLITTVNAREVFK